MHAHTGRQRRARANSCGNANVVEISFTKEVSFQLALLLVPRFVRCFVACNAWVARGSRGVCFMHSIIAYFCAHTPNKSSRSWEKNEWEGRGKWKGRGSWSTVAWKTCRGKQNFSFTQKFQHCRCQLHSGASSSPCYAHVPIATTTTTATEEKKHSKRGKEDKNPKQQRQQPLT